MFSSRSVQIAAVFSDVFGQALPNLCRSFYNETKAEMFFSVFAVALLAEGVDRNTRDQVKPAGQDKSPSSRRAWIEIFPAPPKYLMYRVALLAEGVDRNDYLRQARLYALVALLAEGVDRNWYMKAIIHFINMVALLAEGVDRNIGCGRCGCTACSRPPRGGRG